MLTHQDAALACSSVGRIAQVHTKWHAVLAWAAGTGLPAVACLGYLTQRARTQKFCCSYKYESMVFGPSVLQQVTESVHQAAPCIRHLAHSGMPFHAGGPGDWHPWCAGRLAVPPGCLACCHAAHDGQRVAARQLDTGFNLKGGHTTPVRKHPTPSRSVLKALPAVGRRGLCAAPQEAQTNLFSVSCPMLRLQAVTETLAASKLWQVWDYCYSC